MPESHGGTGLVTADGFTAARCPVNYDKAETHDHKQEANPCKTGSLGERERKERERLILATALWKMGKKQNKKMFVMAHGGNCC